MVSVLSNCCIEDLGVIITSIKTVLLISTFSIFGSNLLLFKSGGFELKDQEIIFNKVLIWALIRIIIFIPVFYFVLEDSYQLLFVLCCCFLEIPIKLIAAVAVSKGDVIYNQASDYTISYLIILVLAWFKVDISQFLFGTILIGRSILFFWYFRYYRTLKLSFRFSNEVIKYKIDSSVSKVGLYSDIIKNLDGILLILFVSKMEQGYYAILMLPYVLLSVLMAILNQIMVKPITESRSKESISEFTYRVLKLYRRLVPLVVATGISFYFLIFKFHLWVLPNTYAAFFTILILAQGLNYYAGPSGLILTLVGHERKMQKLYLGGLAWWSLVVLMLVYGFHMKGLVIGMALWVILENLFKLKWLKRIVLQ
jgi:hypothetical protein